MAKLSSLKFAARADVGAAMTVMDPLDLTKPMLAANGSPSTLTLLGLDSAVGKRLEFESRAARQARETALARAESTEAPTFDPEELAAEHQRTIDKLVELTIDWSGFEDDEGNTVAFSKELVRELYEQNEDIVYQALAFYYDKPRFFAASATPSAPSPTTASDSIAA